MGQGPPRRRPSRGASTLKRTRVGIYATVTDMARVAAELLATKITRHRLTSPFTAREVYRNEWTGLTEPRVVQGALETLAEWGWIRPETIRAHDGGRPSVRFHINPRLAGQRA